MTTEQMKAWIDVQTYETLLHKWRFAPVGDPFFQGEVGGYFSQVMAERRDADPAAAVSASKSIGRER